MTVLIAEAAQSSLWKIAEQVPALVVLVILVSWFLKYLREEREFQKDLAEGQEKVIQEMNNMLVNMSQALGKAVGVIERAEGRMKNDRDRN